MKERFRSCWSRALDIIVDALLIAAIIMGIITTIMFILTM